MDGVSFERTGGQVLHAVSQFIRRTPLKDVILVVMTIASVFFLEVLTTATLCLTISTFATRMIIDLLDQFNPEILANIKKKGYDLIEKNKFLVYVIVIPGLAIALIHPVVGIVVNSLNGIVQGIATQQLIAKKQENKGLRRHIEEYNQL